MIDPRDRQEIRDLTCRYNDSFDSADAAAWVGTFTEDGVFESRVGGRVEGRAALLEWFDKRPHHTIHATTDALVEGDGDTATQVCTVIVFERLDDGGAYLRSVGRYSDRLRRTPDGWRFTYRNPVTMRVSPPPVEAAP
jgi:ketosteroid isomerase-like protein